MSSPVCYHLSASQLFSTGGIWAFRAETFKMTSMSLFCLYPLFLLSTTGTKRDLRLFGRWI
jgi:hypothetical protein